MAIRVMDASTDDVLDQLESLAKESPLDPVALASTVPTSWSPSGIGPYRGPSRRRVRPPRPRCDGGLANRPTYLSVVHCHRRNSQPRSPTEPTASSQLSLVNRPLAVLVVGFLPEDPADEVTRRRQRERRRRNARTKRRRRIRAPRRHRPEESSFCFGVCACAACPTESQTLRSGRRGCQGCASGQGDLFATLRRPAGRDGPWTSR